jgi:hypothetical protein
MQTLMDNGVSLLYYALMLGIVFYIFTSGR